MKYKFNFTKVKNKVAVTLLLRDVLQVSLIKANKIFDKNEVELDSKNYPLLDTYIGHFYQADKRIIIERDELSLTKLSNLLDEVKQVARQVIKQHTKDVLLTQEEYQELSKYKGLYHDLLGSIRTVIEKFDDSMIKELIKQYQLEKTKCKE